MYTKNKLRFSFALTCLFALAIFFTACQKETTAVDKSQLEPTTTTSVFQKALADNTQWIDAEDRGNGTYQVVGQQGTIIKIDQVLVDAQGNRVTGDIQIQLIEIYSPAMAILLRKQTLAEVNGEPAPLESGGEVMIKAFQNGEELSLIERGEITVLLPVANTASENSDQMELFYGEERGEQVIWLPTGEAVDIVSLGSRNEEYYQILISTLGWANVDLIFEPSFGEPVECINVSVECELCDEEALANATVAIYVPAIPSAFEIPYAGGNSYRLCSGAQTIMLGGASVSFIVALECQGQMYVAIVNTTVNMPNHNLVITCDDLEPMSPDEFQDRLNNL